MFFSFHLLVLDLLILSTREMWNLSVCNRTGTQNPLARKRALNQLAELAKWLRCVLGTYLHAAFVCIFLPCHACLSESINTLQLPECQGTPWSKQAWNLKFKCLQLDRNPQSLSRETNIKSCCQSTQMIELCSEYLSVWYIWLCVLVMSCLNIKEIYARRRCKI